MTAGIMKMFNRLMLCWIFASPSIVWANDLDKANEQVVLDFIAAMDRMHAGRAVDDVPQIVARYWTENCLQHRAGVAPGCAGLIASLKKLPPMPANGAQTAVNAIQTLSISSVQDRVILIRRSIGSDPNDARRKLERYVFNVYRLENGKIAENWWSVSSGQPD